MDIEYIRKRVKDFHDNNCGWYVNYDFGEGVQTNPLPDVIEKRGVAKWNKYMAQHIGNVEGKRILDIGTSCGWLPIECSRQGAKEIIALDKKPFRIEQSNFFRDAVAWKEKRNLDNISYHLLDPCKEDIKKFGKFDIIFMLAVVYYFGDAAEQVFKTVSEMTDFVLISAKTNRPLTDRMCQVIDIEKAIRDVGFDVEVDYTLKGRPLLVCRKGKK